MANNQNGRNLVKETIANLDRKQDQAQRREAGLRQERAAATAGRGSRRI
jgi:hypothetical protein